MIRLAIDTNACYLTRAGVARYVRGLLKGFDEVAPSDFEIHPVAWEIENFSYQQPQRTLKTLYRELIWARFIAPGLLQGMKANLLHATSLPFIKPPREIREVVTLHDLAVLRNPQRFRPWQRYSTRQRLQLLPRANAIICISRFTADEAMALLHLPAKRLTVVHNGCDFQPGDPSSGGTKPDFAVPSEFFLFVGSLETGKNLNLIREVYALAESQGQSLPPLLIVGSRWLGVPGEGPPPKNWHYLGHLPDPELVFLYRNATALVFPSTYEGFGFPLVEAMALGCPVICSPVASLPEIGGNAVLFKPLTPMDYLDAMLKMLRVPDARAELIAKGLVKAASYSWKKCAAEMLEVYRSTLK